MQEYLRDSNTRLLMEYNEAKLHLTCFQTRLEELKNSEELNILYNDIVFKYADPPMPEEPGDQRSPSQVNKELLEVNTELQNLNNAISQDIAMLEEKFTDVFCQDPPIKSYSSTSSTTDNYVLSICEALESERGDGDGKEEAAVLGKDGGEDGEKRVLLDSNEENIWVQNLQRNLDSLKEKLDRAENLKCFSLTTIEELQEQKEALQEKVKMIEERQQDDTTTKPITQTGKQRREQTVKLLEQEEWKEQCTFLNRQMCEARDRADFLEEQLNLTKWTNDFFKTVIDKILEDRDTLSGRKNILRVRINRARSKLCRCFHRLFWRRKKWPKEDVSVLIKKKNEIKAKALDLKEQLEYANHFYNIHEGSANRLKQEIEQLEGKLSVLKEWLRKGKSFFFKRKEDTEDDVKILQKQERDVKKRLKVLRKKLEEVQGSQNCYSSFMETIQQKQEELNKKMKTIEDQLLKG